MTPKEQMRAVEQILHAHTSNLNDGWVLASEVAEEILLALGLELPPRSGHSYKRYSFGWEAFRALRA